VIPPFDPLERLPRALHPLARAPSGPGWNHSELADLLPPVDSLRHAAVLVALIDRADGPRVLLTRRTEALRHHAGQISFPGGSIDAGDADPVAAALREAEEEVGLGAGLSLPLGYLDPFVTITGFHVFPVVATVSRQYVPRLDPTEVAEAIEVPLDFLLDPGNVHELDVEWQGRRRSLLEYRYQGHRIWGATAAMLVNFRRRLEQAT
jgi:8-oxo-dGTP pyrophosphatase MutT (NUDIX family)